MSLHFKERSNIAVIVAHPDDEVLGCGGAIAKFVESGHSVRVVLALRRCDPRGRAEWNNLLQAFRTSCALLGASPIVLDPLLDETLAETHVHLVHDRLLPEVEWADVVLTHCLSDVNQVHRGLARAVEIATRPFRRRKTVLLFEVPTSTDQGFAQAFSPNVFVPLEERHVHSKCEALKLYASEIAAGRTERAIRAKLITRGAEAGGEFAEAFVLVHAFL